MVDLRPCNTSLHAQRYAVGRTTVMAWLLKAKPIHLRSIGRLNGEDVVQGEDRIHQDMPWRRDALRLCLVAIHWKTHQV